MMNILAYQDTYYTTDRDELSYVMKLGETETPIFYGRAVKSPDSPYLYVKISDVVQRYLDVNMPDFRNYTNNVTLHSNARLLFKLYRVTTNTATTEGGDIVIIENEELLETYNVLWNYSYEDEWAGKSTVLSHPVNGHMDSRMKLMWTMYSSAATSVEYSSVCGGSGNPESGSTPSVDSGNTPYTGETNTFSITAGNGVEFNNSANTWLVEYATNYRSVYYVFSGDTGSPSTGYTSGGQVYMYVPSNSGSTDRNYGVTFYPYNGGGVLGMAVSTQGDYSFGFSFNNTDGEVLSATTTANTVTWNSTYPYVQYNVYRDDVLISSGATAESGITLNFPTNTDTYDDVEYRMEAYYLGNLLSTLTWTQDVAQYSPDTGDTYCGPVIVRVKPTGFTPPQGWDASGMFLMGQRRYAGSTTTANLMYAIGSRVYTDAGWDNLEMYEADYEPVEYCDPAFDRYIISPEIGTSSVTDIDFIGTDVLGYNTLHSGSYVMPSTLVYVGLPDTLKQIENYFFNGCSNLTTLHYNGTRAQFSRVRLESHWKEGSGITTISCTDGDISAPSYQYPS